MNKVKIGKSNIEVFPIGLGANAVGGHNYFPDLDENRNKNVVRTAFDEGINLIDTAFSYGKGRSETLIGEVLKEYKREDIIVATKAAHNYDDEGNLFYDNSPAFLKKAVDKSLERLQTDYIDIFYMHYADKNTPKNTAVDALDELKKQGKIRAIGVSNFSLEQLKEANQNDKVDVFQGHYNLLHRKLENNMMEYTSNNQITFIPFYPLASGLLTGKYDKNSSFNDVRKDMDIFQGQEYIDNLEKVEQLKEIANNKNVTPAQLILNWYLTRPSLDVVIPGAKKEEQVLSNVQSVDFTLTNKEINKISDIFS